MFKASGGDGRVTVGNITVFGNIKAISGPGVVLTGPLTTGGPVSRLDLFRSENSAINLNAGAGTSSIRIREAVDTSLTSAAPLRRVDLGSWGGPGGGGAMTAPSIRRLNVAGSFQGAINVASAGVLDLGTVQSTTIEASGSVRRVSGTTANQLSVKVGGDIASASFDSLRQSRIYAGVRPLPAEAPAPTVVSDFVADSVIGRFTLKYVDASDTSVVAARVIRSASLGSVKLDRTWPLTILAADQIEGVTARTYVLGKAFGTVRIQRLENEVRQLGSVVLRAL